MWTEYGSTTTTVTASGYEETELLHVYPPPGGTVTGYTINSQSGYTSPAGSPVGNLVSAQVRSPHTHYYSGFGGGLESYPSTLDLEIYTGGEKSTFCFGSCWTDYISQGHYSVNVTIQWTLPHFDPLTVSSSGTATVNATELDKTIATGLPVVTPQNGGTIAGGTYSVSVDNPLVVGWLSGTDVVVKTGVIDTVTTPWSASESGIGAVQQSDGLKLIATSGLSAPNGDTSWAVSDTSSTVITSMSANQVFAQTDDDADNIADDVDTDPATYSDDFSDGTTSGSIVTRGDQILEIVDASDPADGVLVTALAGGGSTPAEVSVSGGTGTASLDAGDSVILTTSSAGIQVLVGPVDAVLVGDDGNTATVSIPAGNELVFDPATFSVTTPPTNPDILFVEIGDEPPEPISPGETDTPLPAPPVVTVPDDFELEATSHDGAEVLFAASAIDAFDGPIIPSCTPTSGTTLELGEHLIECEATDSEPLTGVASFTVTVVDTLKPTITAPDDLVVENTQLDGATGTDLGEPVVSDTADPEPDVDNDAPAVLPIGDTTVTWTATDGAGNFDMDTQTVTVICGPGYFAGPEDTECQPAPAGHYVAEAGAVEATPCEVGTFQSLTGQTSCDPAPEGTFVDIEGAESPTECLPGTYQDTTGNTSCIDAPAGSHAPVSGMASALECDIGTFSSLPGAILCDSAPPGTFVAYTGAVEPTPCEVGTFSSVPGAIICDPAPAGTFVDSEGAVTATDCPVGTFQDEEGQSTCKDAPAGSHTPFTGMSAALACEVGTFSSAPGAVSCDPAPVGSYVDVVGAVEATPCEVGTFQSLPGQTSCDPAPLGHFVDTAGATSATECPPGSFQDTTGQTGCTDAPAGSHAPDPGMALPILCPAGTFSSLPGAVLCDPAPVGTYVPVVGATFTTPCDVGTFQSLTGQIECDPAPAGHFVDSAGAESANECPAGTYQDTPGQISCIEAPPGRFAPVSGMITAYLCPVGTLSSALGAVACDPAPTGHFVPVPGASSATPCALGSYQDELGQISCKTAPIGFFVDASGAGAPTACPVGLTTVSTGSTHAGQCVDLVPPVLTVPLSVEVQGDTAGGAIVTVLPATAWDFIDPSPSVICTAGSVFYPLGATVVDCTATDASGNSAEDSFTVTVIDTIAPIVTVPAGMTVPADSVAGASVTFSASASDVVGVDSGPDCSPISGSIFPIGSTLVTCTAVDTSGNIGNASFTVTVLGGRSLVSAASDDIAPFSSGGNRFRNALRDLDRALDDSLWTDELHPDARTGHQVFSSIRSAAQDLEVLLDSSLSPAELDAVEDALENLLAVSSILASTAIADAEAGSVSRPAQQVSADRQLARAHDYFDSGEAETIVSNAIQDFRKAWEHAQNVIAVQS